MQLPARPALLADCHLLAAASADHQPGQQGRAIAHMPWDRDRLASIRWGTADLALALLSRSEENGPLPHSRSKGRIGDGHSGVLAGGGRAGKADGGDSAEDLESGGTAAGVPSTCAPVPAAKATVGGERRHRDDLAGRGEVSRQSGLLDAVSN